MTNVIYMTLIIISIMSVMRFIFNVSYNLLYILYIDASNKQIYKYMFIY